MDKDRIKGAADQAKGSMKDTTGKIIGDQKLQAEGKADKLKGKAENAVGGAKDALRDMEDRNKDEQKH
ncbi:MAG TPA: CsbD family protein [Rhizomicrobium sp.]|nr:CsbD family protein [Rhizomicrobium sp.]